MVGIRLSDVTVVLGEGSPPALDRVSLDIADGEFLVLAGPSGSGNTTALRTIAGLQQPTAGRVFLDEDDRTGVPAQESEVAMVFQDYGLYAHMRAKENTAFPLEMTGVKPEEERTKRACAEAVHMKIEHLLDRYPGQLAEGHKQAVATARSLVRRTGVLLMDEPLSHLDAKGQAHGPYRGAAPPCGHRVDDRLRHQRPIRGDVARRQGRNPRQGGDPPGGPSHGGVRKPGRHDRCHLPRHAVDGAAARRDRQWR
ncbi:ATP-binding cassette domain-containing protein [bacterium]|nr:ATP-binding cassette domain-containing protein [bacterium]